MSPRAAWRLETLGFTQVYDYVPGKAAWLASGLPTEGQNASPARAGDVVRRDVPTCLLTDQLGDAQAGAREADQDICIVVNDQGVVLGRLRAKALNAAPDTPIEQVAFGARESRTSGDIIDFEVERLGEHSAGLLERVRH